MKRLIVGCGYLGSRVARLWTEQGSSVHAVTRSPDRAAEFEGAGLTPIVADVMRPETLRDLPECDTVLYAVGYDRKQPQPIEQVYVEGLRNVLDALPDVTGRVIYISSTGVYGQTDGEWIDEETPCRPTRAGGRACLAAEELLAASRFGERSIVLRMAGIYGPGRMPRRDALLAGEPLEVPADGWLNLIHVEDAARVVLAAERVSSRAAKYVVSDGHPVQRREYYEELARLVGAPPPRFVTPPATAPAVERAMSDKRVRNARMVRELGVTLEYPTFHEGLRESREPKAES